MLETDMSQDTSMCRLGIVDRHIYSLSYLLMFHNLFQKLDNADISYIEDTLRKNGFKKDDFRVQVIELYCSGITITL